MSGAVNSASCLNVCTVLVVLIDLAPNVVVVCSGDVGGTSISAIPLIRGCGSQRVLYR